MQYVKYKSLYTNTAGSDITSRTVFVGDATDISLSLVTNTTGSGYTLQVNHGEGFFTALNDNAWSTVSAFGSQGEYDVEPGMRWLRFLRPSASSATVALSLQYE